MDEAYVRLPLRFDQVSGRREVVLAEPAGAAGTFIVQSIPAFTYGLGWKDRIRLLDSASGAYEVLERGMQVALRVYVNGSLSQAGVQRLIDDVVAAGGVFEIGKSASQAGGMSLLLLSLDMALGFKAMEALMKPVEAEGYDWEYGNVYDAEGKPLNWW